MPTFSSKPLPSTRRSPWTTKWVPRVRTHPFLFFGLPFLLTLGGGSFVLAQLTQTRYDYNAKKVQTLSKEEELKMRKDRRRIDIREEYFRLQSKETELDDWEPKRIERPEGTPDVLPPPSRSYQAEPSATGASTEALGDRGGASKKKPNVVLGPDGKPCRACNSKLAFSAAMKGAKVGSGSSSGSGSKSGGSGPSSASTSAAATAAAAGAAVATSSASADASKATEADGPAGSDGVACPPDGEAIGRSTWTFLHSAAAYYPSEPSPVQRSSMLALLESLPHLYPCHTCAEALGEEYRRQAAEAKQGGGSMTASEAVKDGGSLRRWLCEVHNEVNARLGKPEWDCADENLLQRRWRDGPEDGSCD